MGRSVGTKRRGVEKGRALAAHIGSLKGPRAADLSVRAHTCNRPSNTHSTPPPPIHAPGTHKYVGQLTVTSLPAPSPTTTNLLMPSPASDQHSSMSYDACYAWLCKLRVYTRHNPCAVLKQLPPNSMHHLQVSKRVFICICVTQGAVHAVKGGLCQPGRPAAPQLGKDLQE